MRAIPTRFPSLAVLVLAALVALAAPVAPAQSLFGDDAPSPGGEAKIPDPMPVVPPPGEALQFYVSPTTTNRFAVDTESLAVDDERLVRFMLIVTSATGVRNVSYEAFRCDRGEQRVLAIARTDGSWSVLRNSRWVPLNRSDTVNRQHPELYARLCDGGAASALTREGLVRRLRATPRIMP